MMLNPPKTFAAARKYRYSQWDGLPRGLAYHLNWCAYETR